MISLASLEEADLSPPSHLLGLFNVAFGIRKKSLRSSVVESLEEADLSPPSHLLPVISLASLEEADLSPPTGPLKYDFSLSPPTGPLPG